MEHANDKRTVNFALHLGSQLLASGAETYRVEQTILHLLDHVGIQKAHAFCVPTMITVNVERDDWHYQDMVRVLTRRIDLERISRLNHLSRDVVAGKMTVDEGVSVLERIDRAPDFPGIVRYLGAGFVGGFFSLLYGGNPREFLAAFIVSFTVGFLLDRIRTSNQSAFFELLMGGAANAALALVLVDLGARLHFPLSLDQIIVGSIMPLVPGVAFTNALRDALAGDLVSGISRIGEALLVAIAIAIGVGVIFELRHLLGVL